MNLSINNLSKTYPNGIHALKNISLTIPNGMYGLLGPNGAGKSTLMRTLATLQEPDSGSILLGTIDAIAQKDELRKNLGYLPQDFGLYPNVTAIKLLRHFAVLKGINNKKDREMVVESLLQKTNLWEKRDQKLSSFSGGMRQRFGIAIALLGNPKLLIVDEPTAGLDPVERVRFLNLLSELGENSVVILSTHIVEDVSELCTRLAIINEGEILVESDPVSLVQNLKGKIWHKLITRNELASNELEHKIISSKLLSGKTLIHVLSDVNPGLEFEEAEPDLKDVYFCVMKGYDLFQTNQMGTK